MCSDQNITLENIIQNWTALKMDEIKSTLDKFESYGERIEHIKAYKKSINNLFYGDIDDFDTFMDTELIISDDPLENMLSICLGVNNGFSDIEYTRNQIQKVDYGVLEIPMYTSKAIKGSYLTYVLQKQPFDHDLAKDSPWTVVAFVFDRLLHELDSIEISDTGRPAKRLKSHKSKSNPKEIKFKGFRIKSMWTCNIILDTKLSHAACLLLFISSSNSLIVL